jgi:UDP-N-acetylmuramate dehydrogenase
MRQLYEMLVQKLSGSVLWKEPMQKHTTFRIGGPADIMILPNSIEELHEILGIIRDADVSYMVVGAGSNLLVSDKGIRGVVIKIGPAFADICIEGNKLIAGAGATLTAASRRAQAASLSGLEFAVGIPGSVGGAIMMNAGAYGGEICQVLESAEVMDSLGNIINYTNQEMHFGYRHSRLMEEELIALSGTFLLKPDDPELILSRMQDITERRREKQPIDMPCAGSVFKRPPDNYVGPLVEKAGLKGYRIGGAEVSTKHAGFIVNVGGATCKDVLDLIGFVQSTIKDKYNVILEPEIRVVGEV